MKRMSMTILALGALLFSSTTANSKENAYQVFETQGKFEEVLLDLQDAIIDQGLVIDFTGNVSQMLERTGKEVGMESRYDRATYIQFCSAKLTHAATKADPDNLTICPYVIFAYQLKAKPDTVRIGYRRPVGASSQASVNALAQIEALLEKIVKQAME